MPSYNATIAVPSIPQEAHTLDKSLHIINGLHTLPSTTIPQVQHAVMTPEVGSKLNVQYSKIATRPPGLGEVVVKIACTGVCRSDLSFSKGPLSGFKAHNHIAGHEGIGHVVISHDPSLLGRFVAARYIASTCRTCWACLRNIPDACTQQKNFPKHHDGTFQEYVTAPWTSFMPLDAAGLESDLSLDPALYTAALCSGAAALKALRQSNIQPDDVVLIFGIAGGIGHLAGMMAKRVFGARVIGVDKAAKLNAFPGITAQEVFDIFVAAPESLVNDAEFSDQIYNSCRGIRGSYSHLKQPDAIIIAASSEEPFQWANLVRDCGTVSCLSVLSSTGMLSVRIAELVERQIRIQGVMMGGWEESYQVLQYIRDKRIRPIVTKVALRDLPAAVDQMCLDAFVGKLVVVMEDSVAPP